MPKQFWDILFKNIECFDQKQYFELLIPVFRLCICPKELFYAVYNIVPKIKGYLDYYEGRYHNGLYWDRNSKYLRLYAHAQKNTAIKIMLLTMLTNPDCPQDVRNEIASSQKKAKYDMVTDIAKAGTSVLSPIAEEAKHTLPFTYEAKDWWNPACSEKIVGDLFFLELDLVRELTADEKDKIAKSDENTTEDVLKSCH